MANKSILKISKKLTNNKSYEVKWYGTVVLTLSRYTLLYYAPYSVFDEFKPVPVNVKLRAKHNVCQFLE
jgi:hypothetical protein